MPQPPTSSGPLAAFLHLLPSTREPNQLALTSLKRASEWLDSQPRTARGLRGKLVLMVFWTSTSIHRLQTLLQVRAWTAKYRERGLVMVGVGAPRFEFERNTNNIRRAPERHAHRRRDRGQLSRRMAWPFRNPYWSATRFIDVQGPIRHHHFGDGGCQQAEMLVQKLPAEAGAGDGRAVFLFTSPNAQDARINSLQAAHQNEEPHEGIV
jgi:hypothetical protein